MPTEAGGAIAIREIDHVSVDGKLGRMGGAAPGVEGPSIYLRDPEGNTIELKGPPSA